MPIGVDRLWNVENSRPPADQLVIQVSEFIRDIGGTHGLDLALRKLSCGNHAAVAPLQDGNTLYRK
jgi:hypothetical protein